MDLYKNAFFNLTFRTSCLIAAFGNVSIAFKSNAFPMHSVRSVRIRSYSGPYFPAFGLNTERYGVSLRIQS